MKATLAPTEYGPTGLALADALALDEWLALCRSLGAMARGHQWWIGDALVYGEQAYGEEFAQGEAELGLEPRTAANYRWVASRVERSRRREDLSWSHHAEVARLGPDAQRDALSKAVAEGWGVRELRDYVALTWPQTEPQLFGDPDPGGALFDEDEANRAFERVELAVANGQVAYIEIRDLRVVVELARRQLCGGKK